MPPAITNKMNNNAITAPPLYNRRLRIKQRADAINGIMQKTLLQELHRWPMPAASIFAPFSFSSRFTITRVFP
ncbi:hypothetical protein UUU_20070 [Klebsiella pneumoniae subsp. pneumoniae DSM 30104 = JCM 1662 = NBRC 14940]|nr:hypothetical protein UUU_20070 [Klebsiella pneumoniae subsp. pneumoniae DSM 30104 = JCM 1662 = NBRC 14940]